MDAEDAALIKEAGAHVSTTPSTELQMGMGQPVAFREDIDVQECCSLGIDCHSITAASITAEMRLLLQSARGTHSEPIVAKGKTPRAVYKSVQDVFNLGTIQGARALKMQDQIGSIAEGKRAGLVVFNGLSPAMIGAAQHDPLAAIVMHSSPVDVDFVIVDGVVRKRAGVLEPVKFDEDTMNMFGERKRGMRWEEVAQKLLQSREALQRKIEKLDFEQARKVVMTAFSVDEGDLA
jgi:cytosine/adenosine deaminase-related metal-dependent hydrolase